MKKRCFKTVVSVMVIICLILSLTVTVFADSTRVVDITKEELTERLWNSLEDEIIDRSLEKTDLFNVFTLSMYHTVYQSFMENYEMPQIGTAEYDDDVSDVGTKFFDYYSEQSIYSKDTEIKVKDNNTIIMSNYDSENKDKRLYWTYDSITDKFIGKDESGKVINSYKRYPVEETATEQMETATQMTDNNVDSSYTERETSTPKTNIAYEDSSGNITVESTSDINAVSPQNSNDGRMVSASPSTETDNTKDSSTTNIILIIIGILIAVGLGIIAYMLKKRKDEN